MNSGADKSESPTRWSLRQWLGISRERLIRGAIFGFVFGIVAACGWFGLVVGTTQKQSFMIPIVGAAIAYGVHKGMTGFGRAHAIIAVAITMVVVIITMYYVERLLVIRWFTDHGDHAAIPLVPYLDWWWSVLDRAFTASPSPALYSAFALVVAGWLGHQGFEAQPVRHHDA